MNSLVERLIASARVNNGGRWGPLPDWAAFYVAVGAHCVEWRMTASRGVTAISVPTRSLAAALVAVGVVAGRATMGALALNPEANFSALIALPEGTAVSLERDLKRYHGHLLKPVSLRGEWYLRVQVQSSAAGGETHFIPERESLRVERTFDREVGLPSKQRGSAVVRRRGFLKAVIGREGLKRFYSETRLDAVVIGRRSVMQHELTNTELVMPDGSSKVPRIGRLADLLRARQLLPPNSAFRTELLSSSSERPALPGDPAFPPTIIFDGPHGYIKWRHLWPDADLIVMLDRTESRHAEAVTVLNQEFTRRDSTQRNALAETLWIPRGVEVFSYREAT